MTEHAWLNCSDPSPMLEFLRTQRTTSERKLRLFATACCRRVWDWMGEKSQRAIGVLERHVDGMATIAELSVAQSEAYYDWMEEFGHHYPSSAAYCALTATSHDAALGSAAAIVEAVNCEATNKKRTEFNAWRLPQASDRAVWQACQEASEQAMTAERSAQCELLREIFHAPAALRLCGTRGAPHLY